MQKFDRFQTYNYDPQDPHKTVQCVPVDLVPVQTATGLYREMVRLRRIEEALIAEYHPGDEMRCPVHFSLGQEAAPAALALILRPEDYLFSHHRSHGFYLAKVRSVNELFAEMYGRENGADGGKAGSQDVSMPSANFFSGAILAGTAPIAAGVAFAFQHRGRPFCAVTATGDGAADEGVYWETLNYASLKRLPMLFLCENNYYSTYSPQWKRSATANIAERVSSFGVEARTLFGNDAINVYLVLKDAVERVRDGAGPLFVETFTYRWNGHVGPESDDHNEYRPPEEIAYWKRHDPVVLLEQRLRSAGLLDDTGRQAMCREVDDEIAQAFRFGKSGVFPSDPHWEAYNLARRSPLADRLLIDEGGMAFDQDQIETLPRPY